MMRPFFCFLCCLSLSACVTRKPKVATLLTAQDFWEEQESRKNDFKAWEGKARVVLEEHGKNASGSGRIFFMSPDKIKMELRDPFGRLHFTAIKKKQSFLAHFVSQKVAYLEQEGGREYLKQKLGVDLPYDEVLGLWLGKLPKKLEGATFQSWEWDAMEGNYVGRLEKSGYEVICHVDGDMGVLKKIEWKKPAPSFQVIYDDLGTCCSDKKNNDKVAFAYSAKFENLNASQKVEVEWEDVFLNPKPPKQFDMDLPKDTEKINL